MNIKEHYRAILTEQLQVAATYGNNIDIDEIVDTLLADSQSSVGLDAFPKQGSWLGRQVDVCFDYDSSRTVRGRIVREDAEHPGRMIITLDDGRHVLSTECQYSLLPDAPAQPQEGVVPDWVMVPREPTEAMDVAAFGALANSDFCDDPTESRRSIYRAMLAAAPKEASHG